MFEPKGCNVSILVRFRSEGCSGLSGRAGMFLFEPIGCTMLLWVVATWHVMSCYLMCWSCHLMRCNCLCCVMSRHAMRCHVMLAHVKSCHLLCPAMGWNVMGGLKRNYSLYSVGPTDRI